MWRGAGWETGFVEGDQVCEVGWGVWGDGVHERGSQTFCIVRVSGRTDILQGTVFAYQWASTPSATPAASS